VRLIGLLDQRFSMVDALAQKRPFAMSSAASSFAFATGEGTGMVRFRQAASLECARSRRGGFARVPLIGALLAALLAWDIRAAIASPVAKPIGRSLNGRLSQDQPKC
jgi:hypothetical protein